MILGGRQNSGQCKGQGEAGVAGGSAAVAPKETKNPQGNAKNGKWKKWQKVNRRSIVQCTPFEFLWFKFTMKGCGSFFFDVTCMLGAAGKQTSFTVGEPFHKRSRGLQPLQPNHREHPCQIPTGSHLIPPLCLYSSPSPGDRLPQWFHSDSTGHAVEQPCFSRG